jgi:hypothetical protein
LSHSASPVFGIFEIGSLEPRLASNHNPTDFCLRSS